MVTSVANLNSTFNSLLQSVMNVERQPLTRLTTQRDTLNQKRAALSDLSTLLSSFRTQAQALLPSSPFFALSAGRTVSASAPGSTGAAVSATASASAMPGSYRIADVQLARLQTVTSDPQLQPEQALGLSGTLFVGGAAARSLTSGASTVGGALASSGTAAPLAGQSELGDGNYTLQTRYDATAGWQFRLVDVQGNPLSIQNGASGTFSSDWQALQSGSYDTGRGITFTFGDDPSTYQAGSAALSYQAQGALVTVSTDDTLYSLVAKINQAATPEGQGVSASLIDRRLVLSPSQSGAGHSIRIADGAGGDPVLQRLGVLDAGAQFKNVVQAENTDASFTVNGLLVHRSQNTGLKDVIPGVTLNLLAETSAPTTLQVQEDWSATQTAVQDFVTGFNKVLSTAQAKTAITKNSDGTFTRAILSDESSLKDLRSGLLASVLQRVDGGAYHTLADIGIGLDDNLQLQVQDSNLLQTALSSHPDDAKALLGQVIGGVVNQLDAFDGNQGYLPQLINNMDNQLGDLGQRISQMNDYLDQRQSYLADQYASMQATITMLSYQMQMWNSIYGTYGSTTLGYA